MTWWKAKSNQTVGVGACSDVGRVRAANEDAYGCFQEPPADEAAERLFVVADGMGGHERGEEASRLAVEVLRQTFFAARAWSVGERLRRAFEVANARVFEQAHEGPAFRTMGTTCTALALVNGHVHMAHVGDSRAYRVDRHGIEQLTRDHTLVDELRRKGVLTAEEARRHPRRHALTRALGIRATLEVDVLEATTVKPPQTFVLCSDGLAPVLDEEIREVVDALPPQQAAERLVAMANERGGPDNVTVLVVAVQ